MDFNYALPTWARGVHLACTVVTLAALPFAIYFGIKIQWRFVAYSPMLCLCLAYENLLLLLPIKYTVIATQQAGWVANALIPPLILMLCFETGYVIHKQRSVKYLGINFDEGKRVDTAPCSWLLRNLVRLISLIILAIGLLVNFGTAFLDYSVNAGMAGYIALGTPDTAQYYVSLVPSFVFSLMSVLIGWRVQRYGKVSSLRISHSYGWSLMLWGSLIQLGGQFPAQRDLYPATSMLGQTVFLVCILLTHREILKDLDEAAKINEFLRRQQVVQEQLAQQQKQPKPHKHRNSEGRRSSRTSPGRRATGAAGGVSAAGMPNGEVTVEHVTVEMTEPSAIVAVEGQPANGGGDSAAL